MLGHYGICHVNALKSEQDKLEVKFFEEREALELKYQKMYKPLYSKRYDIVNDVEVGEKDSNKDGHVSKNEMVLAIEETTSGGRSDSDRMKTINMLISNGKEEPIPDGNLDLLEDRLLVEYRCFRY
ncbi:hypothetical protein L6452_38518 [Arctium lappa]|uniref:Uncharacterized protein n=1 Tax=Arctium lappa TaxID=4217 RepID=A0ACB8XPR3_ARCLA|nr:hypothetical protein L6452_38518 [Arctium lappa]